jgi:hypothetical protein
MKVNLILQSMILHDNGSISGRSGYFKIKKPKGGMNITVFDNANLLDASYGFYLLIPPIGIYSLRIFFYIENL